MKHVLLVISCCLIVPSANAYVGIGSNVDYPEFDEYEPSPPITRDEFSFHRYRNEVQEYVEEAEQYIKNCNEDIDDIQRKQREAIQKANDAVEEFNSWARRDY